MPLCLHVLFHVAHLLHSNGGCEGTIIWSMFPLVRTTKRGGFSTKGFFSIKWGFLVFTNVPSGVGGYRRAQQLTMQRGGV